MATEAVKRFPLQLQQQMPQPPPSTEMGNPLWKTVLVASIAAGVQFGWALQLSLLTPYIQHLGISHTLSSLIWLCGPVSGLLVQPLVGYYSDHCTSRFGRRSPFIAAGAGCVAVAVILIGYAADIGHLAGDSLTERLKLRAIVVFVVGFWILDVANNMLQGPCRAFLADLSANDPKKTRVANAVFSFFMAVGNILGYAAGSVGTLHKILPFTHTKACDDYCANLKTCFFISIALLLTLTTVALTCVREKQWSPDQDSAANANRGNDAVQRQITPVAAAPAAETGHQSKGRLPFFRDMFYAFKNLERPMWWLLFVTCLNWIGWFPFVLFDTDWMGKEVYGGKSNAAEGTPELKMYNMGVQKGALGLMFNSVVLGFTSLGVEVLARSVGGVNRLWGIMNFVLAAGLSMMVVITKIAESQRLPNGYPSRGVRAGALTVFAVLGVPQAITFSIPFALACILSTTIGQGLSLGVLNISIVVPQMVISLVSGPFDSLFGGGNSPAFVVGAIAAAASGIVALNKLPSPPPDIKTLSAPAHH